MIDFILGAIRFLFFFLLAIFLIGFFALKKLQRKAREEMYKQQNPHAYQKQHEGEVELETKEKPMDLNEEYTDYEEIK